MSKHESMAKMNNAQVKSIINIEGVLNKRRMSITTWCLCGKIGDKYEVWTALGQENGSVKRLQSTFTSEEGAADAIVSELKKETKKVFISKNLDLNSLFRSNFILPEYKIGGIFNWF